MVQKWLLTNDQFSNRYSIPVLLYSSSAHTGQSLFGQKITKSRCEIPFFSYLLFSCRQNLAQGWERGGGSFVVYHKGKKVVDIWGGYADRQSHRKWSKDTLSIMFSSTKVPSLSFCATCLSHLQIGMSSHGIVID